MTIDRRLLAAALFASPLAACTPNDINMGAAAKHNYALQIETPEPVYADAAVTSGSTAAAATERYRTDKIKKPKRQSSASGSGGGSSN